MFCCLMFAVYGSLFVFVVCCVVWCVQFDGRGLSCVVFVVC